MMGLINSLLIPFMLILARDSIAMGMIPGAPGMQYCSPDLLHTGECICCDFF